MALIVDNQQPAFKHYCKICKKGFGCGRALGGHMRAHGIGDEGAQIDDDDEPESYWEDKIAPTNTRMYALRTNPNRFKSCKLCENCGKEFLSWKSFLEHGKCSSGDVESLEAESPPSDYDDGMATPRRGCGWSKRKRSFRTKVGDFNSNLASSEEEDLANCLMMLSNAIVDPEPEESCASASRDDDRRNPLSFVAQIACRNPIDKAKGIVKGIFECKACKKVFNSHQALGGHRASHKKVKGCFAARLENGLDDSLNNDDVIAEEEFFPPKSPPSIHFDHGPPSASTSRRKSKVHECSICHRVFTSGQALGGHKRCHWITSNSPDATSLAKFHQFCDRNSTQPLIDLTLDLNLPAPNDQNKIVRDAVKPESYQVSTEINLQPYHHPKQYIVDEKKINNECEDTVVNDEVESKVKLAKLSELKDIDTNSSPWLQVGIVSASDVVVGATDL